jgi:hypothetical protein
MLCNRLVLVVFVIVFGIAVGVLFRLLLFVRPVAGWIRFWGPGILSAVNLVWSFDFN